MRSAFKAGLIGGAVGFALAIFFFALSLVTDALAYVELVVWPASFAFLALDNSGATRPERVEGTAFLMLVNFVWYFVLCFVVTLVRKTVRQMATRQNTVPGVRPPA